MLIRKCNYIGTKDEIQITGITKKINFYIKFLEVSREATQNVTVKFSKHVN